MNAVRAEFVKLLTLRLWWVLLLVMFGYIGFVSGLLAGLFGALGDQLSAQQGSPQIADAQLPPLVYSVATSIGYVFPLILGALATTAEFRYQTLTPTFLATPRRGIVLLAKLGVLFVAGAVYGAVALVGSIGIGAPLLGITGHDAALGDAATWSLAARVVLAMALWAVIGAGVGSLITNQVAAIVVVIAFAQFVEPLLRLGTSIWDWTAQVGKFLPGAASDALVGASVFTMLGTGTTQVQQLEWWQGGLVLAGIAAIVATLGYLTSWRRDVT